MAQTQGVDESWAPAVLGWSDDVLMPELPDDGHNSVASPSSVSSRRTDGNSSPAGDDRAVDEDGNPLTEEEQKRLRNRASVEKCRRKKRMRLESLTRERASLTRENELLRVSAEEARNSMILILQEVAALSCLLALVAEESG